MPPPTPSPYGAAAQLPLKVLLLTVSVVPLLFVDAATGKAGGIVVECALIDLERSVIVVNAGTESIPVHS